MELKVNNCRVCSTSIKPFMTFGKMPIANGFLTAEQFKGEYYFELAPAFCNKCGMLQLIEQPEPEMMFHENYAFFSSLSKHMQIHFRDFANQVKNRVLKDCEDPFVVELGSNDGIMLGNFKDDGIHHLGIEPSENVADVARSKGIQTVSEFFNLKLAEQIVADHGHADVVLSANVMCHIPDINSVAEGISLLLKSDGMLIFEDPYLGDMLIKTSYDQIYDEHVFIFSATSVAWLFGQHGLELIDVLPQLTHGGSMRYVLAPKGSHPISENVGNIFIREREQGLDKAETYDLFRKNCEASKERLVNLLKEEKKVGRRVVGYGATSKSTTILNYCGIGPSLIEFISDTTPLKQGKFSPGMHIPVKPYETFTENYPDTALLLAWNHQTEIMEKEKGFTEHGGRWLSPLPEEKSKT